jgi:hypothetical protein
MEIWKDVIGYEWKYMISNKWNVLSLISNKLLSFSDVDWYKRVWFWSKSYLVHRIVFCSFNNLSLEFKWQRSKTLVLHKNDIRHDNRLENLFLWTQKDNVRDMMDKWRMRRGRVQKVKIWFDDIPEIRKKYEELKNIYKVAPLFWVSYATISRALCGKIWKK